jgi:hypothetical protein
MASKPTSHFVAQLSAIIPINLQLNIVGFWNTMQDSEYESQNKIQYSIEITLFWNWHTFGFANILYISFFCNSFCLESLKAN